MHAALTALLAGLLSGSFTGVEETANTHSAERLADAALVATATAQFLEPTPVPLPQPIEDPDPVKYAVADFAAHVGTNPAEVDVVLHQNVTWPDGSLGCPQPDHFYIPVQVSGYLIVLQAGTEVATYHGASGDLPFRCERPEESPGTP